MVKKVIFSMVAILTVSGCATTASLSPCEKAVLAVYAAQKILSEVCPLSDQPENLLPTNDEGVE